MKRTNLILAAAVATLVAATLSSHSRESGKKKVDAEYQAKVFKNLDANGDAKITEKEFVITGLYEIFRSFDLDGSGKVTKKEFMEATKKHDIDADGEWAAMSRGSDEITFKDSLRNKVAVKEMRGHFKKVDKAGKGYVTLNDLD